MKLYQKSLLSAALLGLGMEISTIPAITAGNGIVQAASSNDITNLNAEDFYYRISKNRFVKADDINILYKNEETDSGMIQTEVPNTFRLIVVKNNAPLYNLAGKKVHRKLSKDTIYDLGGEGTFMQRTYYWASDGKLVPVDDSSEV